MKNIRLFKSLVCCLSVALAVIFCQPAALGETVKSNTEAVAASAQGGADEKSANLPAALLAKETLEALNMDVLWTREVGPSGKKPVQLVDGRLFFERSSLLSRRSSLHAVDAQSGDHLWVYPLNASLDFSLTSDGKVLYALASNTLHMVDLEKGVSIRKVTLPFPPSSPASPEVRGIWIASWDLNLYFVLSSGEVGRVIPMNAMISTAPLVVDSNRIIVGDEQGIVSGVAPIDREKISWQTNLRRPIRSTPVKKDNTAYVGCHDYRVHALDIDSGMVIWSALFEGPVEGPLWLVGDILLVCATGDRLAALDPRERAVLWSVRGGLYPVAVSNELTVVKTDRELVAVDVMTGDVRWTHPASDIRSFAVNNTEPIIYAVPEKGGIVAISLPR